MKPEPAPIRFTLNGQAVTLEIEKMLQSVKNNGTDPAQAAASACGQIDSLLKG